MADDERLRLRSHLAELLSPAQVTQAARGTDTVHDEPVVGGGVKGDAGQDGSNADGPADGLADDDKIQNPKNPPSLGAASESSGASPNPAEHLNGGGTRTWTGGLTTAPADLAQERGTAGQRAPAADDIQIDQQHASKPPTRPDPAMNIEYDLIGRTQPELSDFYQNKLLRALVSKNNPIVLRRYAERRIIEYIMATQTIDDQLAMIPNVALLDPQQFSATARLLNAEILKHSIKSGDMNKVSSATTTMQVLDAYDTAVSSAATYGAGSGGKAKTSTPTPDAARTAASNEAVLRRHDTAYDAAAAAAAVPTPQDPRAQAFDWRERERTAKNYHDACGGYDSDYEQELADGAADDDASVRTTDTARARGSWRKTGLRRASSMHLHRAPGTAADDIRDAARTCVLDQVLRREYKSPILRRHCLELRHRIDTMQHIEQRDYERLDVTMSRSLTAMAKDTTGTDAKLTADVAAIAAFKNKIGKELDIIGAPHALHVLHVCMSTTRQAFKFDADAKILHDPIAVKTDAAIRHRLLRACIPSLRSKISNMFDSGHDALSFLIFSAGRTGENYAMRVTMALGKTVERAAEMQLSPAEAMDRVNALKLELELLDRAPSKETELSQKHDLLRRFEGPVAAAAEHPINAHATQTMTADEAITAIEGVAMRDLLEDAKDATTKHVRRLATRSRRSVETSGTLDDLIATSQPEELAQLFKDHGAPEQHLGPIVRAMKKSVMRPRKKYIKPNQRMKCFNCQQGHAIVARKTSADGVECVYACPEDPQPQLIARTIMIKEGALKHPNASPIPWASMAQRIRELRGSTIEIKRGIEKVFASGYEEAARAVVKQPRREVKLRRVHLDCVHDLDDEQLAHDLLSALEDEGMVFDGDVSDEDDDSALSGAETDTDGSNF